MHWNWTQDFEMAYFTREGAIWTAPLEQGPTPARYTR